MVTQDGIVENLNQSEIRYLDKHCRSCAARTLLIKVLFILMTVILGCHDYSLL